MVNRNQKYQKNSRNQNDKPIVIVSINLDDIGYKSEDEIQNISDRLNKNLRLARGKKDYDLVKTIEKEICYVLREREIRYRRRRAHEKYSKRY